jgi:hypothetical protein
LAAETPASGAIGAAREVPETAVNSNAATAIAKTVRIIVVSPWREPVPVHNAQKFWRFHDHADSK